jgi:hypothetical protein
MHLQPACRVARPDALFGESLRGADSRDVVREEGRKPRQLA